jgi:hypothetical protein
MREIRIVLSALIDDPEKEIEQVDIDEIFID